jgi:hypothetical protein
VNIYRYVRNSPISIIDPLGLWSFFVGVDIDLGFGPGYNISFGVTYNSDGGSGVYASVTEGIEAAAGIGLEIGYVQTTVEGFYSAFDANIGAFGLTAYKDSEGLNGASVSIGPGAGVGVAVGETEVVEWSDWWDWWE